MQYRVRFAALTEQYIKVSYYLVTALRHFCVIDLKWNESNKKVGAVVYSEEFSSEEYVF